VQPVAFFAAGAVFGAAAGLLLAPTSGEELRKNIASLFGREIEKVTSLVKPLVKSTEEKMDATATEKKVGNGAQHEGAR
jgi:gas vesicle protein